MSTRESTETDVDRVDEAVRAINAGNLAIAKGILSSVIQNSPADYSHQTEEEDGSLNIRFWDKAEFVHFVTWKEPTKTINWISSAYPRAFYFLGFIAVSERDYRAAIEYLDRGAGMEPTNPKFKLEKAQALAAMKQYPAAMAIYDQVSEVGLFVQGKDVARALRGKAFILIEMGRLTEAEDALKASLDFEPDSKAAHNELGYIAHLKDSAGH